MQGKDIFCGASSSEKDKIFKEILDIIYKNKGEVKNDSDIRPTINRQKRIGEHRNTSK